MATGNIRISCLPSPAMSARLTGHQATPARVQMTLSRYYGNESPTAATIVFPRHLCAAICIAGLLQANDTVYHFNSCTHCCLLGIDRHTQDDATTLA